MMIRVLYKDQAAGTVKATLLDELIAAGKIAAFFRSGGWVNVELDPIRGKGRVYHGPERREKNNEKVDSQSFFG